MTRLAAALVTLATLLAGPEDAHARPQVDLDVAVDPGARHLAGRVILSVVNTSGAALRDVPLWLYPNRLATRPPALGDLNYYWLYPGAFSPGAMSLSEVRIEGESGPLRFTLEDSAAGPRTVARVALTVPIPPGGTLTVEARFVTQIPRRLGGFGCESGRCRLMGGFYPMLPALGPSGFDLEAPLPRVEARLRATAPPGLELLAGVTRARAGPGVAATVDAEMRDVPYATLIAGRPLHESTAVSGGVRVRLLHGSARPPSSRGEVLPYVREDIPGLILDAASRGLAFLTEQGLPDAEPRELLLVEAPLRHELTQVHGTVVLVSDQLFRVFPAERLRKFHVFALVRSLIEARLGVVLRDVEPSADRDMAAEVIAAYLMDLFALREFRKIEYARDLLNPLDFIPAVDQLIHAPQVASASTYFGDVGRDGIADDVRRLAGDRPSGRLVHQKLVDLLGPDGMTRLGRKVIAERLPLRTAAAEIFGSDLGWFWQQWLGPPPSVNYRVAGVKVERRGDGAHVTIDLERQGADLLEPVEVRVIDRDGGTTDLTWRERGSRKRFEIDLPTALASVEIDPRGRLSESSVGALSSSEDPRVDNRDPLRWKLLYSGFGALLNVSDLSANFLALFTLKRQHDLRNRISIYGIHSESTQVGLGAIYTRLFGPQVNKNQLASGAFAGLRLDRLEPSFGARLGAPPAPGWRLSTSIGLDHDDRDYIIDPWSASGFGASVGYGLTDLDGGQQLSQVSASAEAIRLLELAPGHVLGGHLDVGATWGDIKLRTQLARAGGPGALRGYGPDELLGRGRAVARIELRNRYVSNLSWNLSHLTVVRALAGSFFAGAAALTPCDGYGVDGDGVFFEAGYSFRALHDAFGVHQQLFSLDVAVPLTRRDRSCLGQSSMPSRRPPFVVLITFLPPF